VRNQCPVSVAVATVFLLACDVHGAQAQSLNVEGQTGGVVTPFATIPKSTDGSAIHPLVSFQSLDLGDVIGTRYQISLGADIGGRVEFGYTKSAVATGSAEELSALFDRGFQNLHAKALVAGHSTRGNVPAIAVGGRIRWNREELHRDGPMRNGDIYVVATRSIAVDSKLSILLNGGLKATNASLFAFAGNATGWTAGGFGAAALVVADKVTIGSEVLQQPKAFEGLPEAEVPTTLSAYVQAMPVRAHLSLTLAVVRLAGQIASNPPTFPGRPSVDVKAINRIVLGATVRF
jgi:hypothetical protein